MTDKTDELYDMLRDALVHGTGIRSWDDVFGTEGMFSLSQTARIAVPGTETDPDPVEITDWDSLDWTEAR